MHEEHDDIFCFKVNILSIPLKPVELSHEWVLTNFKYHEPSFYARLFDESEEGPFEFPTGCIMFGVIIKPVSDAPKFYIFSKARVLVFYIHFHLHISFLVENFASGSFK